MTSIIIDWHEEYKNNPEKWNNRGESALREILENPAHERFKEVAQNLEVTQSE